MILDNCELKWNFRMQNIWADKEYGPGLFRMWLMPWEISPYRAVDGMQHIAVIPWDGFPR